MIVGIEYCSMGESSWPEW